MRFPVPWLLLLTGCSAWPRFSHLTLPPDAVEAQTATSDEASVAWVDLDTSESGEPANDDARTTTLETLILGNGNRMNGRLAGSGWDFDAVASRPADCGTVSAFPTEPLGDYMGDVDWRVVDVTDAGVLCNAIGTGDPDARVDALVFAVDDCGVPIAAKRDADGNILGFGSEDRVNEWRHVLSSPTRLALAAAAWAPDDLTRILTYNWELSLISDDGTDCPEQDK